jgi:hypothetical protein
LGVGGALALPNRRLKVGNSVYENSRRLRGEGVV